VDVILMMKDLIDAEWKTKWLEYQVKKMELPDG